MLVKHRESLELTAPSIPYQILSSPLPLYIFLFSYESILPCLFSLPPFCLFWYRSAIFWWHAKLYHLFSLRWMENESSLGRSSFHRTRSTNARRGTYVPVFIPPTRVTILTYSVNFLRQLRLRRSLQRRISVRSVISWPGWISESWEESR